MSRTRRRPSPAIIVSIVSLIIAMGGTAEAATGGNFILGHSNSADAKSILAAPVAAAAMQISNTSTASGATPLQLTAGSGRPPLVVNSSTKVTNLNADKLDNLDSTALQRRVYGTCPTGASITAIGSDGAVGCSYKANDADLLDGLDSTSFVTGPGQILRGALAIPNSGGNWIFLTTATPDLLLAYACPTDLNGNGGLTLKNNSNELVNVFSDNGGTNPVYAQLAANGGRLDQPTNPTGEHITFQIQGTQITTIEVFSVHRPTSSDCHVQSQAVIAR